MMNAANLTSELEALSDPQRVPDVARFFKGGDAGTVVMGVSIGQIFPVAKRYTNLALSEVEALLNDPRYEIRMAAVSVLDFKARVKTISAAERQALFDLYLRRHDRINNWDLVDRAAPYVIGEYLVDRDRRVLDDLARSGNPHERRTALVCTHAFIKRGEVADTFRIAMMLVQDPDDYVQLAMASWVREAGKHDPDALLHFLRAAKGKLPKPTMTAASKFLPDTIRRELRT